MFGLKRDCEITLFCSHVSKIVREGISTAFVRKKTKSDEFLLKKKLKQATRRRSFKLRPLWNEEMTAPSSFCVLTDLTLWREQQCCRALFFV